jgi:hypothetical protein
VLTVISIPLGIVVGRRARKRPLLRYVIDFESIVSVNDRHFLPQLLTSSSGTPIAGISRTTVAIWNHQGDTIRSVDIVPDDRLRIQLAEDDEILLTRVASRSRYQNKLHIEADPSDLSAALIQFDFLDAGDGGAVEVIHQADSKPEVVGTVRGAALSSRGSARLNADALKQIQMRRWKRILGARRQLLLTLGTMVPVIIAMVGGSASWYFDALNANPPVLPTGGFELNTVEGQRRFAQSVFDSSNRPGPSLELLVLPAAYALLALPMALFIVWGVTRAIVPKSLVNDIEDTSTGSDD